MSLKKLLADTEQMISARESEQRDHTISITEDQELIELELIINSSNKEGC